MFLIIVIAIIVLIILAKVGVFRKPAECRACGRTLKGTEQIKFGPDGFVLCRDCASKINPQIMPYAKMNWSFADYQDYLAWEDETKEIRS